MQCNHVCSRCATPEQRHWADEIATRLIDRGLCAHCDGWLYELQAEDFRRYGRPRTDDEWGAHLARFFVRFESDRPWTDARIVDTAASMAEGGWGPEFTAADYGQRSTWIDMCERALRGEIEAAVRPASGV
jgi:hypothetical protein